MATKIDIDQLVRRVRPWRLSASIVAVALGLLATTPISAAEQKGSHSKSTAVSTTHSKSTSSTAKTSSSTKTSSTTTKVSATANTSSTAGQHRSTYCQTCARDSHGRILRGDAAKDTFKKNTGYPHGRPGYVIDHIVPLACGGRDDTSNMQWQTVAEAKAKDKVERKGCGK